MTLGNSFDLVGQGTAVASACASISQPIFANTSGPGAWNAGLPPATPTTYTYSGPLFTTVIAPYTTSMRVTGSIQISGVLPPNMSLRDVTGALLGFSYSDGIQTRTLADSVICNFQLGTGAAGQIVEWNIMIRQKVATNTDPFDSIDSVHLGLAGEDLGGTNPSGGNPCGISSLNPFGSTGLGSFGTFSGGGTGQQSAAIPVLSPAFLTLLAGLLAAAGCVILRAQAR